MGIKESVFIIWSKGECNAGQLERLVAIRVNVSGSVLISDYAQNTRKEDKHVEIRSNVGCLDCLSFRSTG